MELPIDMTLSGSQLARDHNVNYWPAPCQQCGFLTDGNLKRVTELRPPERARFVCLRCGYVNVIATADLRYLIEHRR